MSRSRNNLSAQDELFEILARNPDISADRLEELDLRPAASKARRKNKYGNRRTRAGERVFDSKKEAERFLWLESEAAAGRVTELTCQQPFTLLPAFTDALGRRQRAIQYVADFTYRDRDGLLHVEDVKSSATAQNAVFRLKWKWLLYLHREDTTLFEIV